MAKKFKIDEATRKKMMGLVPITSDFTMEFTPDLYNDIPEEFRPVFKLKPWCAKELRQMAELGADDEKATQAIGKQIVGWSNVINLATEEEIPFETNPAGGIKQELMEQLPAKVTVALLTELSRISGAS